jgi:hypothetical protein
VGGMGAGSGRIPDVPPCGVVLGGREGAQLGGAGVWWVAVPRGRHQLA